MIVSPLFPHDDASKTKSEKKTAEIDIKERYQKIAEAAYLRSEKRGFAPGYELADWLEAEAAIDGEEALCSDTQRRTCDLVAGNPPDLAEKIRLIALRTLAAGGLDQKAIRSVVLDIAAGVEQGASRLGENGRAALRESVKGLEGALSDLATAAKVSIEEARGRSVEYSKNELRHIVDELQALKSLSEDTLEDVAVDMSAFKHFGDQLLTKAKQRTEVMGKAMQEQKAVLVRLIATSLNDVAKRLEDDLPKDKS